MSEGQRMSLPFARVLARKMVDLLEPYCDRIEIAGSIRREKPDVGDVEIVCIPKMVTMTNLLGESISHREPSDISAALIIDGFVLAKNGDHFKQAHLPNGAINFDIFLTTPECWGMIFTIRTGSADFTHRLVTPRSQGGMMPSYLQAKDGRIVERETGNKLDTPEEADVFKALKVEWIEPKDRR